MSSFELNKIAAAVLLAGIIIMVAGMLGNAFVAPHYPAEPAIAVVVPEEGTGAPVAEPPALEPVEPLLAAASPEAGEAVYRRCAACHTVEAGGPNRVGPNLWEVVGADKAAHPGFAYSNALSEMEGTWTYEALNAFLHSPRGYVPGTNMAFAGIRSVSDRADLIAYLRLLSEDPEPLPEFVEFEVDVAPTPEVLTPEEMDEDMDVVPPAQ